MATWNRLPSELKFMVFEKLKLHAAEAPRKAHMNTKFACVCKEWQLVFEKENFRSLTLSTDTLDHQYGLLGNRFRPWLQHLHCFRSESRNAMVDPPRRSDTVFMNSKCK
ncbi:hypothetical protein HD806DRAFT_540945 [Xylariaceae sp. AK1471]|nr:hypothetical protein HD806DRAFT_540945 [Xylariaceae sp. AK1471]